MRNSRRQPACENLLIRRRSLATGHHGATELGGPGGTADRSPVGLSSRFSLYLPGCVFAPVNSGRGRVQGDIEGDVDPGRQRHLATGPTFTTGRWRGRRPGAYLLLNTAVSNNDSNERSPTKTRSNAR